MSQKLRERILKAVSNQDYDELGMAIPRAAYEEMGDSAFQQLLEWGMAETDAASQNGYWHVLERLGYDSDGPPESFVMQAREIVANAAVPFRTKQILLQACFVYLPNNRDDSVFDAIDQLATVVLDTRALRRDKLSQINARATKATIANRRDAQKQLKEGTLVIGDEVLERCLAVVDDPTRDFRSIGFDDDDKELLKLYAAHSWTNGFKKTISDRVTEASIGMVTPQEHRHQILVVIWEDDGPTHIVRDMSLHP